MADLFADSVEPIRGGHTGSTQHRYVVEVVLNKYIYTSNY